MSDTDAPSDDFDVQLRWPEREPDDGAHRPTLDAGRAPAPPPTEPLLEFQRAADEAAGVGDALGVIVAALSELARRVDAHGRAAAADARLVERELRQQRDAITEVISRLDLIESPMFPSPAKTADLAALEVAVADLATRLDRVCELLNIVIDTMPASADGSGG